MGGRRRDFDGAFAVIDINFILDDPRLDDLTASDRWVYLTLWCIAVRERRETLPKHYGHKSVARRARVDARTTTKALTKLEQLCLISLTEEKEIIVYGVIEKHKNMDWKDSDIKPVMELHKPPRARERKEKDKEKDKEKKKEKKKTNVNYSDDFMKFYKLYPKRVEKKQAYDKWTIHVDNPDEILSALQKQISVGMFSNDPKFIKHPSRWISGRCWENEIIKSAEQIKHEKIMAELDAMEEDDNDG